jgi:uncharacterized membrane protein
MPSVQRSIDIDAPIEDVFGAATDPNRGPEWNPNIQQVDIVRLPIGEGSQWEQTAIAMGRPMRLTCTVSQFQPPSYGELLISGDQQGRTITRCQSVDGRTRLTQALEFVMPGGMLGRMVGGMVEPMLGRELEQSLRRIKMTLELENGSGNGSGATR